MPTQPSEQRPPQSKRRGPGKPFQKGDPRIKQNLDKAKAEAPPPPEVADGLTDAGRFRAVWEQSPDKDQNDAQRRLRRMLNEDAMAYFKLLHSLEKAEGGKPDENGLPPDENEDRVRKLMKELLDAADRGAKL